MLVLSRRRDECVLIDGNIRVRVLDIRGNQVRLGFEAPEEIRIYREELETQGATVEGQGSVLAPARASVHRSRLRRN
jgi:carbon storage regulator